MSSERFYADLPPLTDFAQVLDGANYHPLPDDWNLYVADVKGSTQAIRDGHYRSVNLVGAACITGVLNACDHAPLPYVFGGDGATLAAPASLDGQVSRELAGVAAMAQAQFNLELRVGRVPMRELRSRGHAVSVTRYRIAGGDTLAMLRGDGIHAAERWIKEPGSSWLLETGGAGGEPHLDGLSCRWEPLRSRHGEILSLLLEARVPERDADAYYRDLYARLQALLALPEAELNPVQVTTLVMKWPPPTVGMEASAQAGRRGPRRFLALLRVLFESLVAKLLMVTGGRVPGGFNPGTYIPSMVSRSDYRKFDGMLRMVVDAPAEAIPRLLALLDEEHRAGRLFYGLHRSPSALMTCVVFSFQQDSHVHFVDGNDGGYALAAAQLKQQLQAAKSSATSTGP